MALSEHAGRKGAESQNGGCCAKTALCGDRALRWLLLFSKSLTFFQCWNLLLSSQVPRYEQWGIHPLVKQHTFTQFLTYVRCCRFWRNSGNKTTLPSPSLYFSGGDKSLPSTCSDCYDRVRKAWMGCYFTQALWWGAFLAQSSWKQGSEPCGYLGKSIPGQGSSQCRGPEKGELCV